MASQENEELVEQGVSQYRQGNLAAARETLEMAKSAAPNNADVPYYLGRIYLEENLRSKATTEWQQYVRMAPESDDAMKIRKYLTLLLREKAAEFAKTAVANEAALLNGPVAENTITVTSFSNIGSEALEPLGKGLAAMLISDLSQVSELQVVERVKLQALLQEMDLGTSGVVNPLTLPRVGKLLKSKHVATGSLADSAEESLQIFSAMVDTEQTDQVDSQEAKGALQDFFTLEKQIACGIIEDVGRNCDDMPEAFNKIHTKSLAALTFYSVGLDYFDQEKYDKAREQFQKAVEEDPDFDLAKESLAWTPKSAMLLLSGSQMVSTLSAGARPSSDTAVVRGGAAAEEKISTGAVEEGATEKGGISTGWLIGGGVAGAAAIAAAVAGSGGGDHAASNEDVTGEWTGTWTDSENTIHSFYLSLSQSGTSVSGNITITGECNLTGSVSGTVKGQNLELTTSGSDLASLTATCTDNTMNGTLNITSGDCAGASGAVTATTNTGSFSISW